MMNLFLRLCHKFFGSKRLLTFFIIMAPLLVFFLATVAVLELPLGSQYHTLPTEVSPGGAAEASVVQANPRAFQDSPNLEIAVRVALLFLVGILLYVPVAWLFQFSRLSGLVFGESDLSDQHNAEARAEFLGWLTAISVPYLVLGFSMTIEFHALLESPTKGAGAIAAIMVLYALSVLSSFLYIEVRDLRRGFSKEMQETGEWLRYSLALANYQTPIGTPAQNVTTLLKKWIEMLGRSEASDNQKRELRQNLLGTLLASYIKEESENICGEVTPDRTPSWVSEIKKAAENTGDAGGVALIATNVGFYAQYLATAVKGIAHSIPKEQCVVLATVTYVLPPFWWNWPYATAHHGIYEPIEKFRKTLIDLAQADANNGKSLRVFRRMLVRSTAPAAPPQTTTLSDKALNDIFESTFSTDAIWRAMKDWRIIKGPNQEPLTSRVRSPINENQLVDAIRWTEGDSRNQEDESQVYWMSKGATESGIDTELIETYYNRLMHPAGGSSEVCEIDFKTFRSTFTLEAAQNAASGGLNGCPEITFIGVCDRNCDNVWQSEPKFGLAFLSNMNKGQDSILLVVVIAEKLVDNLWDSVCRTLNSKVVDELKSSRSG